MARVASLPPNARANNTPARIIRMSGRMPPPPPPPLFGGASTLTVTDFAVGPPSPVQVKVKVVVVVNPGDTTLLLKAWFPVQPPDATHEVASPLVQVSVTVPPEATLGALLVRVSVGAGGAVATLIA